MRTSQTLVAIVLLLAISGFMPRGSVSSISCPVGNPSPSGATILPQSGSNVSCTLIDADGTQYEYIGDFVYKNVGSGFFQYGSRDEMEMGNSGNIFEGVHCYGYNSYPAAIPGLFWIAATYSTGAVNFLWSDPTTQLAKAFTLTHLGVDTTYAQLNDAVQAAVSGDTITVAATSTGLALYRTPADPGTANLTINFTSGAKLGCIPFLGNAFVVMQTGLVSNPIINGGEWEYVNDNGGDLRGVNLANATTPTVENAYFHDNDMGLISSGANGAVTLTNDTFIHNGSGWNGGLTHNFYLSCANTPGHGHISAATFTGTISGTTLTMPSLNGSLQIGSGINGAAGSGTVLPNTVITGGSGLSWTVNNSQTVGPVSMWGGDPYGCVGSSTDNYTMTNIKSYCVNAGGYQWKARGYNSSGPAITASTFAEPDPNGVYTGTQCQESAAIDFPCGGVYKLGVNTPGNGVVIEVGPQLQTAVGVIKFGEEAIGAGVEPDPSIGQNCPFTSVGWPVNSITIDNAWVINDYASSEPVVWLRTIPPDFTPFLTSCVIENSKIINATIPSYCTDGGGNTFYADRTAAGLAAYPALPNPP